MDKSTPLLPGGTPPAALPGNQSHTTPRPGLRTFSAMMLVTAFLCLPQAQAQQQPPERAEARADLRKEIEELKQGQQAIQKELQELKKLLLASRQPAAAPAEPPRELVLDIGGAPLKGDQSARLTLIEYSDYQCPFCSRYVRDTLPLIERDYIKTGKIRYVFRDFPLESIHPNALLASEAAACASEQGKYWEMHERLFGHPNALGAADMPAHAQSVGLDPASFKQCLDSGKHRESIRKGMTEAVALGVSGTPTFFIGLTSPNDSKVKIIRALKGAAPYANFKEVLDGLLASAK